LIRSVSAGLVKPEILIQEPSDAGEEEKDFDGGFFHIKSPVRQQW